MYRVNAKEFGSYINELSKTGVVTVRTTDHANAQTDTFEVEGEIVARRFRLSPTLPWAHVLPNNIARETR